jgi:tRNA(Leu) C34 or U34 (ribose-2'-O)-methylase TrmL
MSAAVLLIDPHFPHNVGKALRACALLGAGTLYWTALYVFGLEDGDVPKGVRHACHRFVRIPAADPHERTPYNLAFSVGAVLYDRLYKVTRPTFELEHAGGAA